MRGRLCFGQHGREDLSGNDGYEQDCTNVVPTSKIRVARDEHFLTIRQTAHSKGIAERSINKEQEIIATLSDQNARISALGSIIAPYHL